MVIFLLVIQKLPSLLPTKESILAFSNVLNYFPSGNFCYYLKATDTGFIFGGFANAFIYLLIAISFLFVINLKLIKILKTKSFGLTSSTKHKRKVNPLSFISNLKVNPLVKKNIIYTIRSPRTLVGTLYLLGLYIFALVAVLIKSPDSTKGLKFALLLIPVFQVVNFVGIGANIFAYDYEGVISYFIYPITSNDLVKSKYFIPIFFACINMIFGSIFLFLFKIDMRDFIFLTSFLIIISFIFMGIGYLLSVYFPKSVGFYSMIGPAISFSTLIITLILLVALYFVEILLFMSGLGLMTKLILIVFFYMADCIIYIYRKKLIDLGGKILLKQKGKIIRECQ